VERLYLQNQDDPEVALLRLGGLDEEADQVETDRALVAAVNGRGAA
jgi:hypothetical protein